MKTVATTLAALILTGAAGAASASVAFTDFGPGMAYDTSAGDALSFGLDGGGAAVGYAFTPVQGGVLSGIEFAASNFDGPDVLVSLWTSGLGTELGSWDATLPSSAGLVSVALSGPAITLTAGQTYVLQIFEEGISVEASATWYANSTGAVGTLFDGGPVPDQTLGAFEIDVTPEPAAWALMLTGFAGLGGVLRSRRSRLADPLPT